MALTATMYHLQVSLSDVDRQRYETLDLRLARHPSESARYLFARTLAYCLCYEEGIAFSRGLAAADEPALWVRDLQGTLCVWIDVGVPAADRLHKASKAADRVVVVTYQNPQLLKNEARARAIHRAERIEVLTLEPSLLDALEAASGRNARWELTHTDGQLYLTVDGTTALESVVTRRALTDE